MTNDRKKPLGSPTNEKIDFIKASSNEELLNIEDKTLKNLIESLLPLFSNSVKFLLISLAVVFLVDVILLFLEITEAQHRIVDRTVVIAFIAASAAKISIIIVAAINRLNRKR